MAEGEIIVITLKCGTCGKENRVAFPLKSHGESLCASCQTPLLTYQVVTGRIYILSNPKIPGLLKIGFTTRPVEERAQELNAATGVPAPFVIEAYFPSAAPEEHEGEIYRSLTPHRVQGKEFFEVGLDTALSVIEAVVGFPSMYVRTPPKQQEKVPALTPTEKELLRRGVWEFRAIWSCAKCGQSCSMVYRQRESVSSALPAVISRYPVSAGTRT